MDNGQGKVFAYVRVSRTDQCESRQVDLMKRDYCIEESDIFIDKISGTKNSRPKLDELQRVLREGDTVVVESLSRISRSSASLLVLLSEWQERGITFISHKERLDFSTVTGKLMLALIAALSEFERDNLRERVMEGMASAKARGRVGGRPKSDKKALDKAVKLHESGVHSIKEICELTKISKSVLYRALKECKEAEQSQDGGSGVKMPKYCK